MEKPTGIQAIRQLNVARTDPGRRPRRCHLEIIIRMRKPNLFEKFFELCQLSIRLHPSSASFPTFIFTVLEPIWSAPTVSANFPSARPARASSAREIWEIPIPSRPSPGFWEIFEDFRRISGILEGFQAGQQSKSLHFL